VLGLWGGAEILMLVPWKFLQASTAMWKDLLFTNVMPFTTVFVVPVNVIDYHEIDKHKEVQFLRIFSFLVCDCGLTVGRTLRFSFDGRLLKGQDTVPWPSKVPLPVKVRLSTMANSNHLSLVYLARSVVAFSVP